MEGAWAVANVRLPVLALFFAALVGRVRAESGQCGGSATYELDDGGVLRVSGTGVMSTCSVSDKSGVREVIINSGVRGIPGSAFNNWGGIVSASIPETVTSIDGNPFSGCTSLKSIVVSDRNRHYKSVDGVLFTKSGETLVSYPCGSSSTFIINDNVTEIGENAFLYCYTLASVVIGKNVASIGIGAFRFCTNLAYISIGNSVTSIGNDAFRNCQSLVSVSIPDSVTWIGLDVFHSCVNLVSVIIPDSVTSIGGYAFQGCNKLASIHIPDGLTSIEDSVFSYCTSLVSINIPSSATSIGDYAFQGCGRLKLVTYCGTNTTVECSASSNLCDQKRTIAVSNAYSSDYFCGCKVTNSEIVCSGCAIASLTDASSLVCDECKSGYAHSSNKSCTLCDAGFYSDGRLSECMRCPEKYWSSKGMGGCMACNSTYKSCSASNGECTKCFEGYGLKGGECHRCSNGEWSDGSTGCKACNSACNGCDVKTGNCTGCHGGYELDNGACIECNVGEWSDGSTDCKACNSACKGCDVTSGNCTKCYSTSGLVDGACVPCKEGFFSNGTACIDASSWRSIIGELEPGTDITEMVEKIKEALEKETGYTVIISVVDESTIRISISNDDVADLNMIKYFLEQCAGGPF